MLVVALTLAVIGGTLLVGAFLAFWHRRDALDRRQAELITCEAPAPDDSLCCNQEIGHTGWHRHAENSWYGDAWNCDHRADTQEGPVIDPEPTMDAKAWPQAAKQDRVPNQAAKPEKPRKYRRRKPRIRIEFKDVVLRGEPRDLKYISGGYIPPDYLQRSQRRVAQRYLEEGIFVADAAGVVTRR